MNVLKSRLRITIATLLGKGVSQHEIARRTGVDRKTIRRYQSNVLSFLYIPGSSGSHTQILMVEATDSQLSIFFEGRLDEVLDL